MLTGEVFGDAGLEVVEQLCRLYEVRRFTLAYSGGSKISVVG
jgi:hypothetical protein